MKIKESINNPILVDSLLPNVGDLHHSTVIGMKDIILNMAEDTWRKRRGKNFFKYLKDNDISFLDTQSVVIALLKNRLTSKDLEYVWQQILSKNPEEKEVDDGFEFLCKALDFTDVRVLIESGVMDLTTDDVDFSCFIEREY